MVLESINLAQMDQKSQIISGSSATLQRVKSSGQIQISKNVVCNYAKIGEKLQQNMEVNESGDRIASSVWNSKDLLSLTNSLHNTTVRSCSINL